MSSPSFTRRCWAPSWRSRSIRRRAASAASTMRIREARSSSVRAVRYHRASRRRGGAAPPGDRPQARTTRSCAPRATRIVEAADAARRRIERDLHDGAQQRLARRWRSTCASRRTQLERRPDEAAATLLDRMRRASSTTALVGAARARPRHPPGGAHRARPRGRRIDALRPRATGAGRGARGRRRERPRRSVEATAYFVVAEALTNVAKLRAGDATPPSRIARADGDAASCRSPTTACGGADASTRLGPERAGRPRRRHRRAAVGAEPARQGHRDPRRAARAQGLAHAVERVHHPEHVSLQVEVDREQVGLAVAEVLPHSRARASRALVGVDCARVRGERVSDPSRSSG